MANGVQSIIFLVTFVQLILRTAPANLGNCGADPRWVYYKGKCYLASEQENVDFYTSEDFCQSERGHLVSIGDEEENGFLIFGILRPLYPTTSKKILIGLKFVNDVGSWPDHSHYNYNRLVAQLRGSAELCTVMTFDPAVNQLSGRAGVNANGQWMQIGCGVKLTNFPVVLCEKLAEGASFCAPGSRSRSDGRGCEFCPRGFYQPIGGRSTCESCNRPGGQDVYYDTLGEGATDQSQCIPIFQQRTRRTIPPTKPTTTPTTTTRATTTTTTTTPFPITRREIQTTTIRSSNTNRPFMVTSLDPSEGLQRGGQLITIGGSFLGSTYLNPRVSLGRDPCHVMRSADDEIVCRTPGVDGEMRAWRQVQVTVSLSDGRRTVSPIKFTYKPDPRIIRVPATSLLATGGQKLDVLGEYLRSPRVAKFVVRVRRNATVTEQRQGDCVAVDERQLQCDFPRLIDSVSEMPPPCQLVRQRLDYALVFDGIEYDFPVDPNIEVYGPPLFDRVEKTGEKQQLRVWGAGFIQCGLTKDDLEIFVGSERCHVVGQLSASIFRCDTTANLDGRVWVRVGLFQKEIKNSDAKSTVDSAVPVSEKDGEGIPDTLLWGAIVGGGIVFFVIIIIIVAVAVRCGRAKRESGSLNSLKMDSVSTLTMTNKLDTVSVCSTIRSIKPTATIPPDLLVESKRVKVTETVEKGQYGNMCIAKLDGKPCLMKTLNQFTVGLESSSLYQSFISDCLQLRNYPHPQILPVKAITVKGKQPMVLYPLLDGGDLRAHLRNPHRSLAVFQVVDMCTQIAGALSYLASQNFTHKDVAARNVVVTALNEVKLTDCGLAKDVFRQDYWYVDVARDFVPIRWMAPEAAHNLNYSPRSDIWSFGVLAWEMLTRCRLQPYAGVQNAEILNYLSSGSRLSRPAAAPVEFWELIVKCWLPEPGRRPTAGTLHEKLRGLMDTHMPEYNFSINDSIN